MTSVKAIGVRKADLLKKSYVWLCTLLALFWSPVAQAAADDRANFPPIYTMSPKGVNIQTGRFLTSTTEFSIGPLSFTRFNKGGPVSYMNLERGTGVAALGGWFHNHALAAKPGMRGNAPYIYVYIGGQKMEFAVPSAPGSTYPAWNEAAQGWVLVRSGAMLIATNNNGDEYRFQFVTGMPQSAGSAYPDYAIVTINFADGHKVDYSYNSGAQPRTIISNRGYAIVLDYNSSGFLTTACGYNLAVTYVSSASTCAGATMKTSYTYSTSALATVTDVSGAVTTFTHTGNNLVASISLPGSSTFAIQNFFGPQPGDAIPSYTHPDQVRKQITATGDVWLYRYEPYTISDIPQQPGEKRDTYSYVTYPTGESVEAKYINGVVESIIGPSTDFTYGFDGLTPTGTTYSEGNKIILGKDYAQNIVARRVQAKPGSGLPDAVQLWTYPEAYLGIVQGGSLVCQAPSPKLCNKAITYTDARGNVTDYSYDPAHGGTLTETAPAVNGIRPQTRYTYAQRFAWIKDASGAFVRAATPVWVLVQKSICKAGAALGAGCVSPSDEVRTAYDYGPDAGPNNLLLRGTVEDAGGLNLRTCYGYDWRGNKVSETSPRAGLAVCP